MEDIDFAVQTLKYFSSQTTLQGRCITSNDSLKMEVRKEPFGCVGLITPWNYPLLQAIWKLSPALAYGNTVVIKPSEFSSLSTLFLGTLLNEIDLPKGVVNIVTGDYKVGRAIVQHESLEMVSFTGSDRTGKTVISEGALQNLKKVSVELGGKSAIIVHKDAKMTNAVSEVFWGCMYNMG
jgi:aldehyde dehydrogenase (NAD+)